MTRKLLYYFLFLFSLSIVAQAYWDDLNLQSLEGREDDEVVNIITPPDGLGGFGDLVSNLYMAEHLVIEGFRVNVFVDLSFKNKFETLMSDRLVLFQEGFVGHLAGINYFLVSAKSLQVKIGDQEMALRELAPIPGPFTHYVTFSTPFLRYPYNKNKNQHLMELFVKPEHLNKTAVFKEYQGMDSTLDGIMINNKGLTGDLPRVYPTGPLALGMYIRTTKSKLTEDGSEIVKKYVGNIPPTAKLAFTYTKSEETSHLYIEALAAWAQKYPDETFVLISRWSLDQAGRKFDLPSNLTFIHKPHIPFSDTKKIIAAASLPIMITGDMSLTLPIEEEKNFFYEKLEHKFIVEDDLRNFNELNRLPALSIKVLSDGLGKDHGIVPDPAGALTILKKGFEWFHENPDYLPTGLSQIRRYISLPARFSSIMKAIGREQLDDLFLETALGIRKSVWDSATSNWVQKNFLHPFEENRGGDCRSKVLNKLKENKIKYQLIWTNNSQNNYEIDSEVDALFDVSNFIQNVEYFDYVSDEELESIKDAYEAYEECSLLESQQKKELLKSFVTKLYGHSYRFEFDPLYKEQEYQREKEKLKLYCARENVQLKIECISPLQSWTEQ